MAKRKKIPEVCSLCGLDPTKKANRGRQIYVCDSCDTFVCSGCSESGPASVFKTTNHVICNECLPELVEMYEGEPEPEPSRCSGCGVPLSRSRAANFSVCSEHEKEGDAPVALEVRVRKALDDAYYEQERRTVDPNVKRAVREALVQMMHGVLELPYTPPPLTMKEVVRAIERTTPRPVIERIQQMGLDGRLTRKDISKYAGILNYLAYHIEMLEGRVTSGSWAEPPARIRQRNEVLRRLGLVKDAYKSLRRMTDDYQEDDKAFQEEPHGPQEGS